MPELVQAGIITGDFDGDGVDELAVSSRGGAGSVYVYDTPDLTSSRRTVWESPLINDAFGASIAVTDLDADGVDKVAVGAPSDSTHEPFAGAVYPIVDPLRGL